MSKKCKFKYTVSSKSVKICKKVVKRSQLLDEKDERDLEIENLKNENLKLKVEIKEKEIEMQEKMIKNL